MMLIHDLVSIDEQAEFRNDVQLSDYDNPKDNLGLLRSFIFSYNAPTGWESAVGLLRTMIEVFTISHQENRLVCIADYGHGKSHLALALANYFGKSYGSPEMNKVLEKLAKAVDKQSLVDRFKEFRQNRPEFLVIRLRGDMPGSLREQFLSNLEQALHEHSATQKVRLPYWSEKARELLEKLDGEQKKKAAQFLAGESTDLPSLMQDVKENRDHAYYQCLRLFTHLLGVEPNLGGQVSLGKMLKDVARDYCGEGKPLGGVCILFDEFSLYIQRHVQHGAAGDLQDLLNGVEDLKNKAIFLAFSQHDPITVAKNYAKSNEQRDSLLKELGRIPKKVLLYSLMESVIDAYLDQPENVWRGFRADRETRGPLANASMTAMEIYHDRYENILKWGPEKFDEVVTRGSFPLHPLTTALLCNLKFAGADIVGNPRTVLGFVFEQINRKKDEPVLKDGKINWVLPVYLVDYFRDYLGEQPYQMYLNAQRNLPTDVPDEQDRLLKALLLQEAAKIKPHRDTQPQFLSEAAGVPSGALNHHMLALKRANCVNYDDLKHTYSLWSVTSNPDVLGKKLQKMVEGKEATLEMVMGLIKDQPHTIPVSIVWGHSEDWEAKEIVLSRRFLSAARLREQFSGYRFNGNGELQEGVRGGVVWVIAETEEDLSWLRSNATAILDEAFPGDNPLPVVLKLPGHPYPNLLPTMLRLTTLASFSDMDRKECGVDACEFEKKRLKEAAQGELVRLRGEPSNYTTIPHRVSNYVVPAAYRAALELQGKPSISQVLTECYNLAYRFSPPTFFTTYKNPARGTNNLWKATRLVASNLMKDSLPSARHTALQSDKVAKDMVEKFIWGKWKLVSVDYRVQEPEDHRIRKGWERLDEYVPAGEKEVMMRNVLLELLNPPYGYDYNTLTLLFSAWVGRNYHDLQFSRLSGKISLDDLIAVLNPETGKPMFIWEVCKNRGLAIARRDRSQRIKEAQADLEAARKDGLSIEKAKALINNLTAWSQDEGLTQEWRGTSKQAADNLSISLKTAQDYDTAASVIQTRLSTDKDLHDYISIQNRIRELPQPGQVQASCPKAADLESEWKDGVTKRVESECRRLEKVEKLQDIGRNQDKLKQLKTTLKSAKLPGLEAVVARSLDRIAEREQELTQREQEVPVLAEIQAMNVRVPLYQLREYEQRLINIDGLSDSTMKARSEKLVAVQTEMAQLETLATGIVGAVDGLSSLTDVDRWQRQCLSSYARFEGSDQQKELDQAQETVRQVREALQALDQISHRNPFSIDDARDSARKLEDLARLYASTSTAILQTITQTKARLNRVVQEKVGHAQDWLTSLKTRNERGDDPYRLMQELNNAPAFLLSQDRSALESLRQDVQKRMDQDVVAKLEHQFRQITDAEIRQECLNRLQRILAEENGVAA